MSDRIPPEVFTDILTKLSIEDIVRCTAVCKSWYSHITSSNFISSHTEIHRIATNPSLLLLRDYDDGVPNQEHYSIRFDNDTFGVYSDLVFPLSSRSSNFTVVGCINGVVCLSDDDSCDTDRIVLWNPSIRKFVTLPEPIITYSSHGDYMLAVGFGFDAVTNDFKVVRVAHCRLVEEEEDSFKAEVYELSLGCWRMAGPAEKFPYAIDDYTSQVFLNGAVHWAGREHPRRPDARFHRVIVSFDVTDEAFRVTDLPNSVEDLVYTWDIRLFVLGESLAFVHYAASSVGSDIWVMKRYGLTDSWTKLYTIDLLSGPFGFRENGDALLRERTSLGTMVVSYEAKSKQVKCLEAFEISKSFNVENFLETLTLLGVKGD